MIIEIGILVVLVFLLFLVLVLVLLFLFNGYKMKTRTYNKYQTAYEMHVYDGNKLICHCLFYPAKGFTFPRYHFENFGLMLPDLDYEICRFMKFVHKLLANPQLDLDNVDFEINLERNF